ncbi:hypothetical protein ACGTNG_02475 [Halomonas sp. 1390]
MKEEISSLLEREESPVLEFKRQWYWDDDTPREDMADKWGELTKDLISLANGYINNVGACRYLIFGFSETEKKTYNVDLSSIKQLRNLSKFKKDLVERMEKYTRPSFLDFEIESVFVGGDSLLVFEIPCPIHLIELRRELKTKTRPLDEGAVLVRKGQRSDEVRTATPDEIEKLKLEFSSYGESSLYKKMNESYEPPASEKTIEKTVQLFMDKNSSFSLAENYPVKEKNWKESVVFEVYRLEDGFSGMREFIYVHDYSNQGRTLVEIKRRRLVCDLSASIILIDRPKLKDVERRKANIKRVFGSNYVFFIDEFGYEHLYKDCILPYEKFNLPVYVDGLYDEKDSIDLPAIEKLKEWFGSENEPLFVVSGHGGIGKTTLAKQFLDFVNDENGDSGILFIDSKEIINELSRSFSIENKVSDVFDFYKALVDVDEIEGAKFDKELLKLSIDNGSLIVVLDGIDEVIAKLGDKFDVEKFITSIFDEYNSGLHKTKVLITCRDHFWNEVGKKVLLPEIVLKAFNRNLANDFFEQKLKGDKKKLSKAMDMAEHLAIESDSYETAEDKKTYIPFLLDMIGYLINSQGAEASLRETFESRYLIPDNHTDQLVAQVCRREIVKLDGLSIDQQVGLFIRMASRKQNGISLYDIKSELQEIVSGSDFDDSLIEKVKGHPLVQCENNMIYFRYDVFDTYFKSLLVYYFFKQQEVSSITGELARIVSGYLKYDTSFTASVAEKLVLDDELVIFCIDAIESINSIRGVNREMFVSAIVSLLLTLLQKGSEKQSNIQSRTELLEKLFGENESLVGVCLVDIFGDTASKPTFDLRGRVLKKCVFNNYEYFWECSFDENTIFHASLFKDIDPRSGVNYKIPENLFSSSCDVTLIQHLLTEKQEEFESARDVVKADLERVFKLFYQRGNFYPRKQEEVRKKLSAVKLLQKLLDKGVVRNYKDPKKPKMKQYRISEEYKSVVDYIEQGSPSSEFQSLIEELT